MRWLGRCKRSLIGLDIGTRAVKAVQLVRRGGAWSAAAMTLIPRQLESEPPVAAQADADAAAVNAVASDDAIAMRITSIP